MTREEISEQAAWLATAMMIKQLSRSGANDMIETATDKMVDFYRATLEEAARAGCWYCKNSNVATFETDDAVHGEWFHHFDDETPSDRCRSAAIHDLIAAMNKEVPGE